MSKKRYVVVGTGGRSVMFIDALAGSHREHCELVGFCDPNPVRMAHYNGHIAEKFQHRPVSTYGIEDFDRMIETERPDTVVVTSVDSTHHTYIIRAMELGCDAISEKPMTTDAGKLRAIFDAIDRTGKTVRVTFNVRYVPLTGKVRQLVRDGVIGRPLAVDFSWLLDTSHGADYFRRWHREKDKSGGLLVHKATHHFDMVNWWIDSRPESIFAMGDLKFYGRENANARGETYTYDRYTGHDESAGDPFALNMAGNRHLEALYLHAEKEDGYLRDRNVFGDGITAEDTMSLCVRYRSGVIMSYALIAYSPWEGYRIGITGDKGRIEVYQKHGSHIITGQGDDELAAEQAEGAADRVRVFPMFGVPYDVEIPVAEGGHGGGDPILIESLFSPNPPPDPLNRAASHIDGAASILIGISANESIRTGLPVRCDDLLALPD